MLPTYVSVSPKLQQEIHSITLYAPSNSKLCSLIITKYCSTNVACATPCIMYKYYALPLQQHKYYDLYENYHYLSVVKAGIVDQHVSAGLFGDELCSRTCMLTYWR